MEKSEKKMKRLLKNPGILGLSHLWKGSFPDASGVGNPIVLLLYIIVISIKHSAIECLRFLLQGRMNNWVILNTTRYIRLYFLKEIFSWTWHQSQESVRKQKPKLFICEDCCRSQKCCLPSPNVSRHINILQKNLKTASRPRLRTSPSSRQSSLCK